MAIETNGTLLELDGIDISGYSCRGLSLQIAPLDSGPLKRDANGVLRDLTIEQFRKYSFTITCEDVEAPVLQGVYKGQPVSITLIEGTGLPANSEEEQQEFSCMLMSWQTNRNEAGARTGWTITLLEV